MSEHIVYLATVNETGKVDAQVRPMAGAQMEGYALILSVMVRATINMFKEQGVSEKEAVDTILKRVTREVRNPVETAEYSAVRTQ